MAAPRLQNMPDKNKSIRLLLLALLLFIPSNTLSEESNMLSAQSTVGDILRQPEFQGFAAKLLPWDNLPANDPSTPLSRIDSLMPYHNNISTSDILAPLNKMITDVRQGKQFFYDFYPAGDSKRQHTGLFFFAGKPGAPFAVICPGGGFSYVGSLHEGFPLALKLSQKGFNAFVIKYRSGSADFALQDFWQNNSL